MDPLSLLFICITLLLLVLLLSSLKFEISFEKGKPVEEGSLSEPQLEALSNTEYRVLRLLSEGKSNQEIANELSVSVSTAKKHVSNIFKKLSLSKRSEARRFKQMLTES